MELHTQQFRVVRGVELDEVTAQSAGALRRSGVSRQNTDASRAFGWAR